MHIVGEFASELIHIGQSVMNLNGAVSDLVAKFLNYPALTEYYKLAALDCTHQLEQQKIYSLTPLQSDCIAIFYISMRVPISMTRLVGILKKSAAFIAFLDNDTNRRSRHFVMPGVGLATIMAREMKNEVSIMSKDSPSGAHNASAAGKSGVSMKPKNTRTLK